MGTADTKALGEERGGRATEKGKDGSSGGGGRRRGWHVGGWGAPRETSVGHSQFGLPMYV